MDPLTHRFNSEVVAKFTAMLRSQYHVHPRFQGIKDQWHGFLEQPDQLINGPFLEAATSYASGESLDVLPLHEQTKVTIREVMGGRPLLQASERCTTARACGPERGGGHGNQQWQDALLSTADPG